ncbi:hypothetical protein SAMN05421805_12817 [Saccharopolyspora antimicrobica]|uniref:Uncharacterized protein n=1 Tax=Saccharopolyspora antimicrobica TaxID=455193 RepID=A0A1I5KTB8_9PSEU|nr:hypothetical protein [Saccharopolyspora antimicrobica]RKT89130.1 hypothetical protein ATL45_7577 [Saccharopolyspora antimicrobica]SFO88350.1 hypothetical protein SAMN05421805_12817 [Saccharopolyspora antimicrobica]
MSAALSPIIRATAHWLANAYPAPADGALSRALVQAQADQAVTAAAWLRYPTPVDTDLVLIAGPGGSSRLDVLIAGNATAPGAEDHAWRTWVDEVVASWAACLLGEPPLAAKAVDVLVSRNGPAAPDHFRRLTSPSERELDAAALLRHPDLLAPLAELHRRSLHEALSTSGAVTP